MMLPRVTYRRYLIEQVYLDAFKRGESIHPLMVLEAVSSTAIEHPEWPMNEERTRPEWQAWERDR